MTPAARRATTKRQRRAATRRTQRYRQRLLADEIVAPVKVNHMIINMLIDTSWLAIETSENRKAVGDAIGNLLCDAAKRAEIR